MKKPLIDPPNATPADWNPAAPERIPEPTVWPATLSLGVTFLIWGLISSILLILVGAFLFIVALVGWIREIRHERTHS